MDETIFMTHKYFVFKLPDILNNSFHMFEEKRMESLLFVLGLCMDTYDEMNSTVIGTDKLEKSYRGVLNALAFQLKKHPFHSLDDFRSDFDYLRTVIESKEDNSYEVYVCMRSLKKKLERYNLPRGYVECLQHSMSYQCVDNLIEAFVSDLLFWGYSLNYLCEWYKENMRTEELFASLKEKDIGVHIAKLEMLNGEKKEYEIIIPYRVNDVNKKEVAEQVLSKNFEIKEKGDFSQYVEEWAWDEEKYACKGYWATDCFKAIKMAKKEFETERELIAMWMGGGNIVKENKQVGYISENKINVIDIRKVDNTKLISYYDKNRTEQLNNFIDLKDKMKNEDVDVLERILHTLHIAKNYNIQNRYLNFWSALEYAIYSFTRNSIIEKARVLVPESFTLFYVKNKMNTFWERISYTMEKENAGTLYPKCYHFVEVCKENHDFSTQKMIEQLQAAEVYKELVEETSFNIVLQRELQELIMLVTEPEKMKKVVEEYRESILHDLDCVYRLRNQLIHSAKSIDDSLEHISLRLYRYVNSIVATILYYKKRDAMISIDEILNSIHNTFEVYMERLDEISKRKKDKGPNIYSNCNLTSDEGYKLVRPKYLFLE